MQTAYLATFVVQALKKEKRYRKNAALHFACEEVENIRAFFNSLAQVSFSCIQIKALPESSASCKLSKIDTKSMAKKTKKSFPFGCKRSLRVRLKNTRMT